MVCPTASLTTRLPVEAFALSLPAATVVERSKLAGPVRPEPPSLAVQPISTLSACQSPSAEPQLTLGSFLSTLFPPSGPAVVVCPTPSVSTFELVNALAVSFPAKTFVVSEKLESLAGARPDPPSAPVHPRLTSTADQAAEAAS